MSYISLTPFGAQPVSADLLAERAQISQAPAPLPVDKWSVMNDLSRARKALEVSDRDLVVLQALLTFLPAKELAHGAPLTVFPSNRSLSERAHGMAESTLRRHLAALVAAGLIWRNDSPNGKRYARRDYSGDFAQTFGFDLTPLFLRAPEFADLAHQVEALSQEQKVTRERVVLLLRDASKLLAHFGSERPFTEISKIEVQLEDCRKVLKRKLDLCALRALEAQLADLVQSIYPQTVKMSASAAQNERHHSNSNIEHKESESALNTSEEEEDTALSANETATSALPLNVVLSACTEFQAMTLHKPATWHEFFEAAEKMSLMMGIPTPVWQFAKSAMGKENAAITLAAMLQRFTTLRKPGAYLRNLSQRAKAGLFTPIGMVLSLFNTQGYRTAES